MNLRTLVGTVVAVALLCTACSGGSESQTSDSTPALPAMVFTMTNATAGNTVVAYRRSPDGTLETFASAPTGGTGVGHGLENQGALTVSQDGHFVYAVNPGSDDLSVLAVSASGLQLASRIPSGGTLPVSVAEQNGVVYVLNRHGLGGSDLGPIIQGFRITVAGMLTPIPASTVTLSTTDTNGAQIAISPDSHWLLVTERAINQIDVIALDDRGSPGGMTQVASAGQGPFGFAISDTLRVYIAESVVGTTSAYNLNDRGELSALSAAVPTSQRATCWTAISPDNNMVYVSNTASKTISQFRIMADGSLSLIASVAASTTGSPLDLIVDRAGNFLSVLSTDGSVETFAVDKTSGALSSIQVVTGLPAGTSGLAG